MLAICKPEILPNLVLCVPALQLSDTNLCLLLEQKQTAVLCGQQHPEATGFSEPPVTSVPKMTQQTGPRHTWWTLETSDAGPSAAWLQTLKSCQINTCVIFHISALWWMTNSVWVLQCYAASKRSDCVCSFVDSYDSYFAPSKVSSIIKTTFWPNSVLWTKAGTQTTHSGLGLRLGLSQVWTYGWKGLLACFMLVIPQLGQTKSKGLSVRIMSVKFVWSLNLRTFTKCSVILVSLT